MCVLDRTAQREEILPLRNRTGHADQQQRHLVRGPGEPSPELHAGGIRPVQVVDHQHRRPGGGLVDGERDELLGQQRGHVGAAVGGDLAAQQPGDRGPPGVHRRRPHLERVEERQERQLLAKFVPGPPEDLAAPGDPRCAPAGAWNP